MIEQCADDHRESLETGIFERCGFVPRDSIRREELQRRLGGRIRELRLKHGWTQDIFADKSGLHRAQIGAFERGEMNITLASLLLVAQTLRVKVVDLFKGLED